VDRNHGKNADAPNPLLFEDEELTGRDCLRRDLRLNVLLQWHGTSISGEQVIWTQGPGGSAEDRLASCPRFY
jgi:hypothetical protein